ncbi:hypothetical protein Tco_0991901 [Tanacetum coccineum]|uniref:Uncharacterized protein n=1 Tax=Tanacetum coccineum TaxID=301880 RepID=A0ABQ5F293_9ASTR
MEVSRLCGMDNDLFTYEVEVANIPCNSKMDDDSMDDADYDMGYDPSDAAFIEWLRSKNLNYKTMDHYTMKTLWIYRIRGDDEVELTDEESSDDEDEVVEVLRIDTNLFNFETPMCKAFKGFNYILQIDPDLLTKYIEGFKTYDDYKNDWIYEWNKGIPWVNEKLWTNTGVWTKPTPVKHTCKPFNYKIGYSEWPTCSWKDDGYCNEANYWNCTYGNNSIIRITSGNERKELCEVHEPPICNIRKYMMIKYSFNNDEEYVAVKQDEYNDLTITRKEACQRNRYLSDMDGMGWWTSWKGNIDDLLVE